MNFKHNRKKKAEKIDNMARHMSCFCEVSYDNLKKHIDGNGLKHNLRAVRKLYKHAKEHGLQWDNENGALIK